MKKNFVYAILSAIALSGAVSFSACSSSDEIIDNPNYDPETNTVKTQFTISFQNNFAKTRQSGDVVQSAQTIEKFRGMDDIVLYPFVREGVADSDPIASTDTRLGDVIALTSVIKPEGVNISANNNTIPEEKLVGNSNSVLFNDISVPVGTGSFLFYGKAIDEDGGDFVNGKLTPSYTGTTAGSITFSPVKINSEGTMTKGTTLAEYLSSIAQAEHWAECATPSTATDYATISANTWFNSGLGDLYTKFTSLKAGSSLTAQAAVQDLYTTILNNTDVVSTNIKNAITNNTYVTSTTGGTLVFADAINGFPGNVKLPDGAALLTYTASDKTFAQKNDGTGNMGTFTAAYANYVYPASLYYYCNSGIVTSNSSQKGAYDGTNTWTQITDPSRVNGYNLTAVGAATRSVAILDQIQYGVGRLDAKVTTGANTLYDKKGEEYDASNGFTVTGILIGGQKQVNFDFTTNTEATPYTIYDNIATSNPGLVATTGTSWYNYTLALETYKDVPVYIAVELQNDGADFEGADGVVPAGCKFYLVAVLDPTNGTGYDSTTKNQVFKQDYKTIANFTIPAGKPNTDASFDASTGNVIGLGKAYNTIPDLRAPEMELGLSVNLEWVEGITFNIDLGDQTF